VEILPNFWMSSPPVQTYRPPCWRLPVETVLVSGGCGFGVCPKKQKIVVQNIVGDTSSPSKKHWKPQGLWLKETFLVFIKNPRILSLEQPQRTLSCHSEPFLWSHPVVGNRRLDKPQETFLTTAKPGFEPSLPASVAHALS